MSNMICGNSENTAYPGCNESHSFNKSVNIHVFLALFSKLTSFFLSVWRSSTRFLYIFFLSVISLLLMLEVTKCLMFHRLLRQCDSKHEKCVPGPWRPIQTTFKSQVFERVILHVRLHLKFTNAIVIWWHWRHLHNSSDATLANHGGSSCWHFFI